MKGFKRFIIALFAVTALTQSVTAQSLTPLLSDYLKVKDALVADDAKAAATASAQLNKDVTAINMKDIPMAKMNDFMGLQTKLEFDSRHISEVTDIAHQREHFASLSQEFYKLQKIVKLNTAPLYYDYCPMKKGYWLSADGTIKNPYYGSKMLGCGRISETIK